MVQLLRQAVSSFLTSVESEANSFRAVAVAREHSNQVLLGRLAQEAAWAPNYPADSVAALAVVAARKLRREASELPALAEVVRPQPNHSGSFASEVPETAELHSLGRRV